MAEAAEVMVEGVVATEQIRGAGVTEVGVQEAMGPHRSRATLQHSKVVRVCFVVHPSAAVQDCHSDLCEPVWYLVTCSSDIAQ